MPPKRSSKSHPRINRASVDALLQELAPFLKRLTEDELAEIPKAAERARNRRGFLSHVTRPEQPIEVVFVRGGALLLRRKWMEEAIAQHYSEEIRQSARWADVVSGALSTWLEFLPANLENLLSKEAEFLPEGLYSRVFSSHDEHGAFYWEGMLDYLEDLSPERIGQALEVPLVLHQVQWFRRNGKPEQKRRVKDILHRWAPQGRGAPTKELDEREDVLIAQAVTKAEARLAEGHALQVTLRERGNYYSEIGLIEELRKIGYRQYEIDAIVRSTKLSGAAQKLVAHHTGRKPASVSAMASRGRKRIRAAR